MTAKHNWHDAWWRLVSQPQPKSWQETAALNLLTVGSLGFRALVALRNYCYDHGLCRTVRLPVPVVSVGNLTVGGTGKTSCVELLAGKLGSRSSRTVAILSRGYGGTLKSYWLKSAGGSLFLDGKPAESPEGIADEPQLLANALEGVPVGVGSKRALTGRIACERWAAQVLLLDDGFQHRQVHRDCDVVLVHARTPFGGWPMLPRGPMREPLAALKRAHVIMITKADEAYEKLNALKERLAMINRAAIIVTAIHEPMAVQDPISKEEQPPKQLEGRRVALLSSIGDPEGFEAMVRRLHATILWHQAFPDHHPYSLDEVSRVQERVRQTRPDMVLTTAKDWMRLRAFAHPPSAWPAPLRMLRIAMKITDGEAKLDARLAGLFSR